MASNTDGKTRREGAGTGARALAALLALAALVALAAGCASGAYRAGTYHSRWTRWRIDQPGDGWRFARGRGVDVAFRHDGLGAALYVDDSCARYEDAPLHVLANHLFFGFTEVEVLASEDVEIDRRAAYRRVVRGRLDGVPVKVVATVVKKGSCVFDLVLIAPPESFDRSLPDYEGLVRSFRVER